VVGAVTPPFEVIEVEVACHQSWKFAGRRCHWRPDQADGDEPGSAAIFASVKTFWTILPVRRPVVLDQVSSTSTRRPRTSPA